MDRSAVAAGALALALAAIFPCWLFGLEQLGPPVILMLGLLVILFGGCRLRVPVTAWVFMVTLLVTLLSLSRLVDLRSIVLFSHGHFNLTTGLVALVLAANAGVTRVGLEKVLRGFVVFTPHSDCHGAGPCHWVAASGLRGTFPRCFRRHPEGIRVHSRQHSAPQRGDPGEPNYR